MIPTASLLAALAALIGTGTACSAQDGPATVIYIVRHAEKKAEPASDPSLTPEGEARARELAGVLRDAGIRHIYSTQFARTRLTALPTATRFGVETTVFRPGTDIAAHAAAVADAVRSHPGGATLIVGHSNTVPAIVHALGAPMPDAIGDDDYDDLFVVVLQAGQAPTVVRARYGA